MKFLSLFHLLLRAGLALTVWQYTATATAQSVQADEWISYRSAYKLMLQFEKYGKPKHLLQSHLQLANAQGQTLLDTQINLIAKTSQIGLQIDPLGRVKLPLIKTAYDENAELRLAGPVSGLQMRLSLALNVAYDGHFDANQLKLACEQALNFYMSVGDKRAQQKRCLAIILVYPGNVKMTAPMLKNEQNQTSYLTAPDLNYAEPGLKGQISYWIKLSQLSDKAQIISQQAPFAVLPVIE